MLWGKLAGMVCGLMLAGPVGLMIGLWVGHRWDQGFVRHQQGFYQSGIAKDRWLQACFLMMGHVAKVRGVVSKEVITLVQQIMDEMTLTSDEKKRAIAAFQRGKDPALDVIALLRDLKRQAGQHRAMLQSFIALQFRVAKQQGYVHGQQKILLQQMCQILGFAPLFSWDHADVFTGKSHTSHSLDKAYRTLGVSASDSMMHIKQAYRRLLNQYHPDKLVAKGASEFVLKEANDKIRDIRDAYQAIKAHHQRA